LQELNIYPSRFDDPKTRIPTLMKSRSSNRRNFLKLGIAAGATALIASGGNVLSAITNPENKETGEKMKLACGGRQRTCVLSAGIKP
jgi:hypothetical protein